jgi:hypothetical protein
MHLDDVAKAAHCKNTPKNGAFASGSFELLIGLVRSFCVCSDD